jgi:hypothetical protein
MSINKRASHIRLHLVLGGATMLELIGGRYCDQFEAPLSRLVDLVIGISALAMM